MTKIQQSYQSVAKYKCLNHAYVHYTLTISCFVTTGFLEIIIKFKKNSKTNHFDQRFSVMYKCGMKNHMIHMVLFVFTFPLFIRYENEY